MNKLNLGKDLYIKGRIGWRGLSKDEYLESSDYKIINATALKDGIVDWDNCGYITEERYKESNEIMLQENDILISKDGTLGKIGYVKGLTKPCTVASGIFVVRNKIPERLNFDYLYHLLKSYVFKDFIRRNKAVGSTINHLYQRDLENFEIDLPSLDEQTKIANILNVIDEKIMHNELILTELDDIAHTLYGYWFLQFDYPDGNGKPYQASGGKMKWSNEFDKMIPETFSIGRVSDLGEIVSGGTPSTKNDEYYTAEGIAWITPKDLSKAKYKFVEHGARDITEMGLQKSSAKLMPKGSVVFTTRAPIGYISIAANSISTNQGFKSIVPHDYIGSEYVYYTIKMMTNKFIASGSGTTFKEVSKKVFSSEKVIIPSKDVLLDYKSKMNDISTLYLTLQDEIIELDKKRQFLLPMLMNGQVKVKVS